jgi:hypothetical protein
MGSQKRTIIRSSDDVPPDPNPWIGVTMKTRVKQTKAAVTGDQVHEFANGCINAGEVEAAAIAVICFEWLLRPENVIAGHIKWTNYRSPKAPTIIRIQHHKTRTRSWRAVRTKIRTIQEAPDFIS